MSDSLRGVTVVVTRAKHQAAQLSEALIAVGANVVELPVIEIVATDVSFDDLDGYEWLVVTSVNTVEQVGARLVGFRGKIAAIGEGTAHALQECGLEVDLIPPSFVAESLLEVFPEGNGRVLLPRAQVARDVLPDGLREKGWTVDVVTAYRTDVASCDDESLDLAGDADVVTFTASSTVQAFVEVMQGRPTPSFVACIGPITANTAQQLGLDVDLVAAVHSIDGLVSALVDGYSDGKTTG